MEDVVGVCAFDGAGQAGAGTFDEIDFVALADEGLLVARVDADPAGFYFQVAVAAGGEGDFIGAAEIVEVGGRGDDLEDVGRGDDEGVEGAGEEFHAVVCGVGLEDAEAGAGAEGDAADVGYLEGLVGGEVDDAVEVDGGAVVGPGGFFAGPEEEQEQEAGGDG